ncbi:MAG: hypothetical protein WDZ59_07200 [Pirellulales bacterium]
MRSRSGRLAAIAWRVHALPIGVGVDRVLRNFQRVDGWPGRFPDAAFGAPVLATRTMQRPAADAGDSAARLLQSSLV